jgi:hypothetical protein
MKEQHTNKEWSVNDVMHVSTKLLTILISTKRRENMKTKKKYYTKHFKNLPLEVQTRIYNLISRGKTLYQIIKLEKVSVSSLHLLFEDVKKPVSRAKIGHRDESYYTEDYMINGYQIPTYEDLSESEKFIYNTL